MPQTTIRQLIDRNATAAQFIHAILTHPEADTFRSPEEQLADLRTCVTQSLTMSDAQVDAAIALHLCDMALWSADGYQLDGWCRDFGLLIEVQKLLARNLGDEPMVLVHGIGLLDVVADRHCADMNEFLALSFQRRAWNDEFCFVLVPGDYHSVDEIREIQSAFALLAAHYPAVHERLKRLVDDACDEDEGDPDYDTFMSTVFTATAA